MHSVVITKVFAEGYIFHMHILNYKVQFYVEVYFLISLLSASRAACLLTQQRRLYRVYICLGSRRKTHTGT